MIAVYHLNDARESNMWIVDPARGTASPISREGDLTGGIVWSMDGREVFYAANRQATAARQDLYARRIGGTAEERLVFRNENMFKSWVDASPYGQHLVFQELHPERRRDLWYLPVSGGEPRAFVTGPGEETNGSFSPDGRWFAYQSDESGRPEVYITSFPEGNERVQVTSGGGTSPRWLRGTGEIRYRRGQEIWSMAVRLGNRPEPGTPVRLAEFVDVFQLDYTHDGRRVVAVRPNDPDAVATYTVLSNWESLLEAK